MIGVSLASVTNEQHHVSVDEQLAYAVADPTTTTNKPWELVVTSRRLKFIAAGAIVVVMAAHIFLAVVVAIGDTGATVTTVDQWAFVGIGIIISLCCLGITRPRVRVNSDGVEVRNFIGTRFYPWDLVYGLSFPKGDHWARLELPEFEYVAMWAFFAADGDRVMKAVADFRALEDRYMPED